MLNKIIVLNGKKTLFSFSKRSVLSILIVALNSTAGFAQDQQEYDFTMKPLILSGGAPASPFVGKSVQTEQPKTTNRAKPDVATQPKKIVLPNKDSSSMKTVEPVTPKPLPAPVAKPVVLPKENKTTKQKAPTVKPQEPVNVAKYPERPINPVVGDIPVRTSADPREIDRTLRVVPDNFDIGQTDDDKKQEAYSLAEIRNPKSSFYSNRGLFLNDGSIRNSALLDAAKGVGVRAGFAYEAERINNLLQKRYANTLDKRFAFFFLMLGDGKVLPPVITEVQDQQERSGADFLYLSIGSYEIVKPASLVLKEPTWREYLLLPVSDPRPPEGLKAEDSKEIEAWKKAVDAGWSEGRREARRTFVASLNRLIRDYTGMQRYHALAKKGAITIPKVQSIKNRHRVDGDRLFIGEERLELKVSARFKR